MVRMPIDQIDSARAELHEQLSRFHNITREQVRVVYDARGGKPLPPEELPGVAVVYAPANVSADDYIVRSLRNANHPARITVVTSDRELGERVKDAGARVMKASAFHHKMIDAFEKGDARDEKAGEKPGRPSAEEIDFFMDVFSDDTRRRGPNEKI